MKKALVVASIGALVEIAPQDFFNTFNVSDDLPRA